MVEYTGRKFKIIKLYPGSGWTLGKTHREVSKEQFENDWEKQVSPGHIPLYWEDEKRSYETHTRNIKLVNNNWKERLEC